MLDIERHLEDWLREHLPRYERLAEAVVTIVSTLLVESGIPYLSVTGRAKKLESCVEKVKRKGYTRPTEEMTDCAGVRAIFYFEHDVERAADLLGKAFNVDKKNSKNRDDLMSVNEVGYRSMHYVCDLGSDRLKLLEFRNFADLKFELQIRTVLQHAWAELAHDRNYKFQGQLPKAMERKLYLLAGLFESADGGFSELSKSIDTYIEEVSKSTSSGNLDIEVNSLTLDEFMNEWSRKNNIDLVEATGSATPAVLVRELKQFGIRTLKDLNSIEPKEYVENIKPMDRGLTIYGILRSWMMIAESDKFLKNVKVSWTLSEESRDLLSKYLPKAKIDNLYRRLGRKED